MKIHDLAQLKNQTELSKIYLILCSDLQEQKFYVQEIMGYIVNSLKLKKDSFSIKNIAAENFSLRDFKQEVETQPFLFSHLFLHLGQLEKIVANELKGLISFISSPSPWVFAFFSASRLAPQTAFYKAIESQGCIFQKNEEKSWEKEKNLENWLQHLALDEGKSIDQKACQLLIKQVGQDRKLLASEFFKLSCYAGDQKEIRDRDVRAICISMPLCSLWQLGDAIFQKNSREAISCVRSLFQEGVAVYSLLAHLRTQFQTAMHILSLFLQKGASAVTEAFPYLKGGFLEKKINTLKSFDMIRLKQGLVTLHDAELMARNSAVAPELLLDLIIPQLIDGTCITSFSQFACESHSA